MSEIRFVLPAGRASPFAGFWRRVAAALIDAAILALPYVFLAEKTVTTFGSRTFIALHPTPAGALALGVVYWAYKAGLESSALQGTLGKRALRIRVADARGRRVSLARASLRGWVVWLPALLGVAGTPAGLVGLAALLSCVLVAFTARKQGAHDLIARCLVLRDDAIALSAGAARGIGVPGERPDGGELSAGPADPARLARLLGANDLPDGDIDRPGRLFFEFRRASGAMVGVGGLEIHGADALLRSLVILEEARGGGWGRATVAWLARRAAELGARRLYLLTTTAPGFFARCGFEEMARDSVPAAIAASEEFARLCPQGAVCLWRDLEAPAAESETPPDAAR